MAKSLMDLNLMDRFLFTEAMEDPEILKIILDIILDQDTLFQQLPQAEKERLTSPKNRSIRLDVMAIDVDGVVYDTEVQKGNTGNLPKRSRYYQSVIDSKLLPPGEIDFNQLNPVYVILIMPFDLFGRGFYRYTFRGYCEEDPTLTLPDDAVRIFLNSHGTHPELVSPELIELLRYMEYTSEETSKGRSQRIQELQQRIHTIKSSEEVGVKYMQAWEEKILWEREAREKGMAEGLAEGHSAGQAEEKRALIHRLLARGFSDEDILALADCSQDMLDTEKNVH